MLQSKQTINNTYLIFNYKPALNREILHRL